MRPKAIATAFLLTACAGNAPNAQTPADILAAEREAAEDAAEAREQLLRERELRAQLALARARAAELEAAQAPRETVRIGGNDSFFEGESDDEGWDEPGEELPPQRAARDRGPRPMLRLYGLPPMPESETLPAGQAYAPVYQPVGTGAPAPSVTPSNERLPWESPVAAPVPAAAPAPVAAPQRIDLAVEAYRSALGLLRSRHFAESRVAFERFLEAHPTHPRAASARYWRAELMYIQREYRQARAAFASYLERYPSGGQVPSALLKLALCHRRLGDEASAQRHLATLHRRFPTSDAARLATRTGREGQR